MSNIYYSIVREKREEIRKGCIGFCPTIFYVFDDERQRI